MDNASIAALDKLTATVPREYQKELMKRSLMENTTVCLPTGSGKTLVAAGILTVVADILSIAVHLYQLNPKSIVCVICTEESLLGVHEELCLPATIFSPLQESSMQ